MTDPNNVPLPQMPAPNGTPAQQNPSTPQYGAPAPAPAQPDYGQFNAPSPAQPAYGQPAYGQPAPDSSAPGAAPGATPAYGQPAADPYAANAAPQFPAPGAAPTYGQPGPDANAYGQVPPAYNQYAAPTATAAVPLNKPYYDCPFPEAFLRFWKKYVVFKGRASRSEFWWWMLASFAIQVVLTILVDASNDHLSFLSSLWSLAILVPSIALSVRRLHDINKPGWWLAIFYGAVFAGAILMIVGGGAALFGVLRVWGSPSDSGYYATAAAGSLGILFIGAIIAAAAGIVYIVFMAMPSKPEGARFDDDAVAAPMPQGAYGAPYGAPATPDFNQAAPNFAAPGTAPNAPAPDFNQPAPAYGQPTAPAPDYGQPAVPTPDYGQVPVPQYGQPETPAPQYGQPDAQAPQYGQVPPIPENVDDGSTVLSPHTAPTDDNAQKPWQGQ